MILLAPDGARLVRTCPDCARVFSFPAGPGRGRTHCSTCAARRKRESDRARGVDLAGKQLRRRP